MRNPGASGWLRKPRNPAPLGREFSTRGGSARPGVNDFAKPGKSNGAAYPNPHGGKKPEFYGGQTEPAYSGGDNPNVTTKD